MELLANRDFFQILQALRIPAVNVSPAQALTLPTTLHTLSYSSSSGLSGDPKVVLPSRLTHLDVKGVMQPFSLEVLPPGLTFLQFPGKPFVSKSHINWPQSLKSLYIKVGIPSLPHYVFTKLPRHVTNLSCFVSSLSLDDIMALPASITLLHIPKVQSLSMEAFEHLPRGLLELDVCAKSWLTDEYLPLLPPGLKRLVMSAQSRVTTKAIAFLPKTVAELHWNGPEDKWEEKLILPPVLETFVCHVDLPDPIPTFDQFPATMKTFEFDFEDHMPSDYLLMLSSTTLTRLDIGMCTQVPPSALEHLPPSLIHLQVHSCTQVSDALLGLLPRGIRSLNIGACVNVSNAGLANLPPFLTRCCLILATHLTDDCINYLPYTLRIFNASASQITKEVFTRLPKNQTKFEERPTLSFSIFFF